MKDQSDTRSAMGSAHNPARPDNDRIVSVAAATVLVIDDEADVRSLVDRALSRVGYHVLCAADGEEGVALFRAHSDQIKCVLIDLIMPRMGGEEALRMIRRESPDVRLVLMSGYRGSLSTSQIAQIGLTSFLQKPFSLNDLRAAVNGSEAGLL